MTPEIENAFIKQQLDCEEVGILVDPKGWVTASQYKKLARSASFATLVNKTAKAQAVIRSCIFFNFFD